MGKIVKETVDSNLNNPNIRKFLSTLAVTEGTDRLHGYYTNVGGERINDLSRHPNKVGLRTKAGPSTAFGRYQITGETYRDIAPKLGITDMSPASQDKIAVALMMRNGSFDNILKGEWGNGIAKASGTWASLPNSTSGQPKHSWKEVGNLLAGAPREAINSPFRSTPVIKKSFNPNMYLANVVNPLAQNNPILSSNNIITPQINKQPNLLGDITSQSTPFQGLANTPLTTKLAIPKINNSRKNVSSILNNGIV